MILVDMSQEEISPDPNSFRSDTLSSKKVAIKLYYLKDQGSYIMTANSEVSKSTVNYASTCH